MTFSEAVHPATGVVVLAGLLSEGGIDPRPLLADAGLDPEILHAQSASISQDRELAFVRAAKTRSPWPDLGLRAGLRHHYALFGAWGLAMVSSPNLLSAIRVGLQHMDLVHTYLRWNFRSEADRAILEFRPRADLGALETFFMERDIAAAVTLVAGLLGTRPRLESVEFPYSAPDWSDAYRPVFDGPVIFGTQRGRVTLDPEILARPLPQANPVTAAAAERHCAALLRRMHDAGPLADQVRGRLLRARGAFPSQARMAADLHMSERTFRRRLSQEGLSFRSLRDEVRRELAETYLQDTPLSLAEIAHRVGFSDAANFSHACRRWFGCAPGKLRRRHPDAGSGRR
jgi:AraC-like DNA-binding protein